MTGLSVADVVKRVDTGGAIQVFNVSGGLLYPLPPSDHGVFRTGDSYIVLHSVKSDAGVKRTIYFWQGKESSVDELGYSAILARDIDDALGGSPVQVRIQQGEETPEFKQLFPQGITLQSGGVASTLHHVTNEPTGSAKMFIVKSPGAGKLPQVTEVQVRAASLCNNASYVLDDPQSHTLYVWHGGHTGMKEKTKVLEVSNTLRQNRGNLRFTVLDQDDTTSADAAAFYAILGVKDIAGTVAAIAACEGAAPAGAALGAA